MRRVSVRGIVLHEGKLLCVKHKRKSALSSSGGDWWCLPGGKVEAGEALESALGREFYEETGVKPALGNLLYVQQFQFNGTEYLEFFFHITNATDYLSIDLKNTTHGEAEIEKIEFVDPRTTTIRPEFLTTEPLVDQAEHKLPVKFFFQA